MITFAQIRNRLDCMRPDKLPREIQIAFQIAAKRFANETFALQEIVSFEVPANARLANVYVPGVGETLTREMVTIFRAEAETGPGSGVYDPLFDYNQRDVRERTFHVQEESGALFGFTCQGSQFVPVNPPLVDTQVRALVAYCPIDDFDEIDAGRDVEDTLIQGALAHLLLLPGEFQNLTIAEFAERRFLNLCSDARGVTLVGDMAYTRAVRRRSGVSGGSGWGRLQW